MTMVELRKKAKELGINSFGMKKVDLMKEVEKATKKKAPKAKTPAAKKKAPAKKKVSLKKEVEVDLKRVAEIAYEIYEKRGCLHGYHDEDWHKAIEIVKAESGKKK
ncbi:DUF2934 domain-containing protein [bacterium]|nr:DUF2934 domain-containing protein [bacterium]